MKDETRAHGEQAAGFAAPMPAGERRRVRMTRVQGQSLVLTSFGGCSGTAGPIEIRFAEVAAGGAATVDFLLPDHVFVEHKETMDSVQALFCSYSPLYRGLEE